MGFPLTLTLRMFEVRKKLQYLLAERDGHVTWLLWPDILTDSYILKLRAHYLILFKPHHREGGLDNH